MIYLEINIEVLAAQAKKGDASAFSALYSMLYKDMYYFALSKAGNPHDAADAVSEAVMDAFSGISKLRKPASFKSWLFKILNRKLSGFSTISIAPDEKLAEKLTEDCDFTGVEVLESLCTLSDDQRTVFSLSVFSGMNSKEISQVTGMNSATVRSHLLRARKKLIENYTE